MTHFLDNRVSAIAVADYNSALLEPSLRRHFETFDLWRDLRPGMKVVIKPNLLMRRAPDTATTTHPLYVELTAKLLKERGITDIVVADSPGGPFTKANLDMVAKTCGILDACEKAGVRFNLETGWQQKNCDNAVLCRSFPIIDPVAEADFVINLPRLKTHAMTTLSAGVKNLFGCVPGLQKPEFHFRFPEKADFCRMLVDLSRLVQPGFTILDAIVGMEGNGPSGGDPRHAGMTFATRNVYALDLAMCGFIGLSADEVHTVHHAIHDGLCPASPEELEWLGDGKPSPVPWKLPDSRSLSFAARLPKGVRRPFQWAEKQFLSPRPVILHKQCIGCGKCAESCAPKAITIQQGKAVLDRQKCIRCYCCHEMCPVKAVEIRKARLLGW